MMGVSRNLPRGLVLVLIDNLYGRTYGGSWRFREELRRESLLDLDV